MIFKWTWFQVLVINFRGTDVENPGNTLFVTGLSSRVTERDLEDYFSKEGKVSSSAYLMPTIFILLDFG